MFHKVQAEIQYSDAFVRKSIDIHLKKAYDNLLPRTEKKKTDLVHENKCQTYSIGKCCSKFTNNEVNYSKSLDIAKLLK